MFVIRESRPSTVIVFYFYPWWKVGVASLAYRALSPSQWAWGQQELRLWAVSGLALVLLATVGRGMTPSSSLFSSYPLLGSWSDRSYFLCLVFHCIANAHFHPCDKDHQLLPCSLPRPLVRWCWLSCKQLEGTRICDPPEMWALGTYHSHKWSPLVTPECGPGALLPPPLHKERTTNLGKDAKVPWP